MPETTERTQPQFDKKHLAEAFQVDPEITAKPEFRPVGQHTAVGEFHIRLQEDQEADQAMADVLSSADVVLVEFDSSISGYEQATEHKRFMSMAQDEGQQKELIIMDAARPAGIESWKKAGIDIDPDNYLALVALDCAQHPVMALINSPNKNEVDQDHMTADIASRIIKKIPDIDPALATKLADGAKKTIMLSSALGGGEIFKLIGKYLQVDSFAREVLYQQQVADRVNTADQKKVVVVVGMSHLDAVSEALSGQFSKRKVRNEILDEFRVAFGMVTMFAK